MIHGNSPRFCFLALALMAPPAALSADVLGADANPTGQPIGGGAGYSAGPEAARAAFRVRSLESLRQALAAAKPGDLVWLESGASIDLADTQLVVPNQVTLAGDRGVSGSVGPLLTAGASKFEWRLQLRPGARLSGVRLRGPNPLMRDVDTVKPAPSGYGIACADAEVDNCAISQFQRGGIALFRDSNRGHIHHNNLHDIAAYPVLVANGSGADHVFEANRIEWAWHAVASNGSRGSGYTARYNLFVRVPRPKFFDLSGADPPNWCVDVHGNSGEQTRPPRPPTRKLIVHHNTFLAHPDVKVGDGSDLPSVINIYPKHDIFVGASPGITTIATIHHNLFLMHERTGSRDIFKPYGRAIRLEGFRDKPAILEEDPAPAIGVWRVAIHENHYSGNNKRQE